MTLKIAGTGRDDLGRASESRTNRVLEVFGMTHEESATIAAMKAEIAMLKRWLRKVVEDSGCPACSTFPHRLGCGLYKVIYVGTD